MIKKINTKTIKLIKFYNFINYNLIYNNKAINRYKKDNFEISGDKSEKLKKLKNSIFNIQNCELKKNATKIVFADGNPKAKIMLIGEGPGSNEDQEGLPFVGRAGALLDKMLASIDLNRKNVYITNVINYRPPENRRPTEEEIDKYLPYLKKHIEIINPKILILLDKMLASIDLNRKNVYITNVVNYRPPENRRPTEEEIDKYLPYLKKHIEIINPKILILLGSTALNALIGNEVVISKARGKWIEKQFGKCKVSIIVTFHPAFLMRQPGQKKLAWIDLKMIREKKSKLRI